MLNVEYKNYSNRFYFIEIGHVCLVLLTTVYHGQAFTVCDSGGVTPPVWSSCQHRLLMPDQVYM